MAKSTKALLMGRIQMCKTNPSIAHIGLATHGRSIQIGSSLIPALSCRSCRPNAPFAELVRLSRASIADEMREEHRRRYSASKTTARCN
jgi:hypothetical protein